MLYKSNLLSKDVISSKCSKCEGLVGISLEIAIILAPSICNHIVSHDPLNPVWPVIRTDLFLKIFENIKFYICFICKL